jgi:ketosteroid isomerase-like protein
MSQENEEIVREQFRAFSAGDTGAMKRQMAPDAVLETDPRFPEGGTFKGVDEVERFFLGLHDGWRDSRAFARDFQATGDRVLVTGVWQATGEASGIEVTSDWSVLWSFREGKIIGIRFFFDRAEALEAAGLAD